jgi:hypothetical protein
MIDGYAFLRRIIALAAKTVENGCTEGEAMAAAAMLAKLFNNLSPSKWRWLADHGAAGLRRDSPQKDGDMSPERSEPKCDTEPKPLQFSHREDASSAAGSPPG